MMLIRLQKYLAWCGIASRRKCEELIRERRISVNGRIVTEMGTRVDPDKDQVLMDRKAVTPPKRFVYFALNKPAGVVVTASDSHGMPIALDLMKGVKERIFTIGRLDLDTEGLLLLTNDGELANHIMHPRFHLEKEYVVTVYKPVSEHNLRWLRKGIMVEGKLTQPAEIRMVEMKHRFVHYKVIICEGRKRQIRLMLKAVGHPVIALKRVAIGPIRLGKLPLGQYRPLSQKEILMLKSLTGLTPRKGVPRTRKMQTR
jgi:pseudouridine synthase